MILEEKGVTLNIPGGLRWEKFDEEDFYRDISHLGLKAVDFVFYGQGSLVFLEIKNFKPNLGKVEDEKLRERKKKEIEKHFIKEIETKEGLLVKLANKLVSTVYIVFGKKLNESLKIIFCILLLLPENLTHYLPFISDSLRKLETSGENLLKVDILVLDKMEVIEEIITSIQAHD